MKSGIQKVVTLHVIEDKLVSVAQYAQDIMYIIRTLEPIWLKVKNPMQLYMQEIGSVNLANSWISGDCTRHIEVRQYFPGDLKDPGTVQINWSP